MIDILFDTLLDSIKLIPFLFITFLLMEFIEHKFDSRQTNFLKKGKKVGPLLGSILGMLPQCGFSAAATNLYITRIITLGTLFAVYLSTSDEMLPIMISNKVDFKFILFVVLTKAFIGLICGFLVDLIISSEKDNKIKDFCKDKHCDCEKNILVSSIIHTLKTIIFIFVITFIFNIIVHRFDKKFLEQTFLKDSILGLIITSLIGLIPSCASSILIVEMYLNKVITLGAMFSGLLTGSGVGLLILFKENKNIKENLLVTGLLVFLGVFFGFFIDIIL